MQALPKLLWELGSSRPEASRLALRSLFYAARFARCDGPIHASCKQLQPSLAVFYCALLPAAAGASTSRLLSPLAKLPVHCQVCHSSCWQLNQMSWAEFLSLSRPTDSRLWILTSCKCSNRSSR